MKRQQTQPAPAGNGHLNGRRGGGAEEVRAAREKGLVPPGCIPRPNRQRGVPPRSPPVDLYARPLEDVKSTF